ncbi:MAG TPA: hypothetical protein PKJ85_03235 [Nitrosomonas nitrosa]|nr:hypothetical protein [Nitrosomonas nitrosa]
MNCCINADALRTYKLCCDGQLHELSCDIDPHQLCTARASAQPAACTNSQKNLLASLAEFDRNARRAIESFPQPVLQLGCRVGKDPQALEA